MLRPAVTDLGKVTKGWEQLPMSPAVVASRLAARSSHCLFFVNKVLLGHSHVFLFTVIYGYFCITSAELSS